MSREAPWRRSTRRGLGEAQLAIRRQAHHTLGKVTDDIGRRRTFNTAIAAVMELLNALARFPQAGAQDRSVMQEALEIAVLALSPIIPHVTHALWRALGHTTALIDEPWMTVDPAALEQASVEIVVQVNGKLRARISVPVGAADEARARDGTGRPERAEVRRSCGHPQGDRSCPANSSMWSCSMARAVSMGRAAGMARPVGMAGRSRQAALAAALLALSACGFRLAGSEPLPAIVGASLFVGQGSVHRFRARVRASTEELRGAAADPGGRMPPRPSR